MHLAWGMEYRLDSYRIEAGEEYSYRDYDGPGVGGAIGIQVFPGFKPSNEVDEARNALSVYVDTELYVSDTFLVSPAVRYEHYSDFGSTINGKVAAKLDLSGEFALRGSLSTGFRAPSMQQLYFNNISTQFRDVGGQQIAFEVGTFRNDSALAKAIGIPELDAETSVTGSVGFVYQPVPAFTLTTDFYHIDVSDRIIISNQFDADTPGISASVREAMIVAGGDRGQFFMNAADTRTQGVDVVATWDVPFVPVGDLGLKLLATVSETEITSVNLPADLPDALFGEQDRSIVEEWQPSHRLTLSGSYRLNNLSAALAVHTRRGVQGRWSQPRALARARKCARPGRRRTRKAAAIRRPDTPKFQLPAVPSSRAQAHFIPKCFASANRHFAIPFVSSCSEAGQPPRPGRPIPVAPPLPLAAASLAAKGRVPPTRAGFPPAALSNKSRARDVARVRGALCTLCTFVPLTSVSLPCQNDPPMTGTSRSSRRLPRPAT